MSSSRRDRICILTSQTGEDDVLAAPTTSSSTSSPTSSQCQLMGYMYFRRIRCLNESKCIARSVLTIYFTENFYRHPDLRMLQ